MDQRRIILVVRDSWSYTTVTKGNAVYLVDTTNAPAQNVILKSVK